MKTTTKQRRRHIGGFPNTLQNSIKGPIFLQESNSGISSPQNGLAVSRNMGISVDKPLKIFKNHNINLQSGSIDESSWGSPSHQKIINVHKINNVSKKSLKIPRDLTSDINDKSNENQVGTIKQLHTLCPNRTFFPNKVDLSFDSVFKAQDSSKFLSVGRSTVLTPEARKPKAKVLSPLNMSTKFKPNPSR